MKPIPLIDGAFLIDNSGLERLKCPRMFEYSELESKSPVVAKAGANFGSTMHRGWEERYKLFGAEAVTDATQINDAMRQWLEENPQPENDFRNYNHACKMMEVYNKIYRREGFELLKNKKGKSIIEATFCLPFAVFYKENSIPFVVAWDGDLGFIEALKKDDAVTDVTPIYYCGKTDLGIRDHNGIWSFDHKTAFQFGETFDAQMKVDGGQHGYVWALQQVLGVKPEGFIIDAVRVRKPKKSDNDFAGDAPIDATDFKRMPFYVSQSDLDEWREDVLHLIENIFHHHAQGHFPKHRWNCVNKYGLCEFYEVCSLPKANRDMILNSNLFEPNQWTKGLKLASENNETKESNEQQNKGSV